MKTQKMLSVVFLGVILSVLAGCVPTAEMKLNLAPQSKMVYKVVLETGKDYSFVQPSINKTKERHTVGRVEMVFAQKVESVGQQGSATADITIKELKYLSQDPEGKKLDFDSTAEGSSTQPLFALIGQSYKIKITPNGKVEVADAKAAREVIKEQGSAKKFADRLFSDEEIVRRHQVLALIDIGKTLRSKGDKWSTIAASPEGMLTPKSFEKIYTLTDIKEQNGERIAIVDMNAVPSSKRAVDTPKEEAAVSFFAKMFEEKDNYAGKMVLNLTTGEIDSYQELLKAEWLAAESSEEQKSDKGPDQLMMGFWTLFSIEKVD
jgi:hypothetical protein